MKPYRPRIFLALIIIFASGLSGILASPSTAYGQDGGEDPTATVTQTNTATLKPTKTPKPTKSPTPTVPPEVSRPLVIVQSYDPGGEVKSGESFDLSLVLRNKGTERASNLIAVFTSTEFLPLETGGVRALRGLDPGEEVQVRQPMTSSDLGEATAGSVSVALSYVDMAGLAYTETFTITVGIKETVYSGPAQPSATPTTLARPQIVVGAYNSSVDPLQPGTIFDLELEMRNLGSADAKAVTMVMGGSSASVDLSSGTPQPGVSGSGSELTNFAPLGTSNLFYLGDIPTGAVYKGVQQLIVNVSTQPGAYPLKLSFVYNDTKGNRIVDDQVITLLVYSLPQLEIGYYRDPGIFFMGQPNQLPLQVTNLGRSTAVLGNLKVSAENAEVQNNVSLVGSLEPGGYFTLDAMVIPNTAEPLTLMVTINYTDNFNQARVVEHNLEIEVQDSGAGMGPTGMEGEFVEGGEMGGPGMEGMPVDVMPTGPETLWQKIVRAVKGLLGLNSAVEQPAMEGPMEGPIEPGMEGTSSEAPIKR